MTARGSFLPLIYFIQSIRRSDVPPRRYAAWKRSITCFRPLSPHRKKYPRAPHNRKPLVLRSVRYFDHSATCREADERTTIPIYMDLMAPGKMCHTPGSDGYVQGGEPSYRYSALNTSTNDQNTNVIITDAASRETLASSGSNAFRGSIVPRTSSISDSQRGSEVFVRGSLLDRHIEATAFTSQHAPEKARDYKGRIRVSSFESLYYRIAD